MRRTLLIVIAVSTLLSVTPLGLTPPAQDEQPGQPRYDLGTETTVTGTVERLVSLPPPGGGRGQGGTHLVLETDTETLEVHLGPTAFLAAQGIALAAGDTVEVLGSRVVIDDQPVLLARELTRGDDRWTLRDSSGRPAWRGGRR